MDLFKEGAGEANTTCGRIPLPGWSLAEQASEGVRSGLRAGPEGQRRLSVAEKDHLCKREGIGMRDGQLRRMAADCFEPARGAAVQLQLRRAAASHHLDVAPQHASRVTGAECLHRRLFRGKASGEMNGRVVAAHAVRHFGLGKNAIRKTLAVPLDGGGNARDVRCVEPDSDDVHASQA